MALQPVVEDAGNKLTLKTFSHLRGARIEEGYALGFKSSFDNDGKTVVEPLIYPPDPDADSINPAGWVGNTQISHQGKVVFEPSGAAPARNTGAFTEGFDAMQDDLFETALFKSMENDPLLLQIAESNSNPKTRERANKFKARRLKKRLMIAGGVVVSLGIVYFLCTKFA